MKRFFILLVCGLMMSAMSVNEAKAQTQFTVTTFDGSYPNLQDALKYAEDHPLESVDIHLKGVIDLQTLQGLYPN